MFIHITHFCPHQKDQSGPSVMREILHGVVVVLHMWLFCWFGSNLTVQVSDFFERYFLFAATDLSFNSLEIQCFQQLRPLLSLFFIIMSFTVPFVFIYCSFNDAVSN
jgi:hypothetical protein